MHKSKNNNRSPFSFDRILWLLCTTFKEITYLLSWKETKIIIFSDLWKFLIEKNMNMKESFARLHFKQMLRKFDRPRGYLRTRKYEVGQKCGSNFFTPSYHGDVPLSEQGSFRLYGSSRVSFLTSLKRRLSPDLKLDLGEVNLGTWRLPCSALHPLLKRRPRNAVFHPC